MPDLMKNALTRVDISHFKFRWPLSRRLESAMFVDERLSMPRKPNFAQLIRDARMKRKLSVAEVADQMGVSHAAVYIWETDRSRPRDTNLSALCKVLKLPVRATKAMAAA
jgi:DNA-binding transcriptional regulator YiaG